MAEKLDVWLINESYLVKIAHNLDDNVKGLKNTRDIIRKKWEKN